MLRIAFALTLLPLPALAETLMCPTSGYCVNDLTCHPDTAVMQVEIDKTGTAIFGWADVDARFTATGLRVEGMRVFYAQTAGAIQTLVLADDGTATFSISGYTAGSGLYTSFQALTCERS